MELNIQVSPEDIEKAVVDAIVKSSIGTQITKSINNALNQYSMQSAIDDEVKRVIRELVRDYVVKDESFKAVVDIEVAKYLTTETVGKFVSGFIEKATRDY